MNVKDPALKENSMDIDEEPNPRLWGADDGGGGEEGGLSDDGCASRPPRRLPRAPQTFGLKAVISCTSDGLIVVLRRARPLSPTHNPR